MTEGSDIPNSHTERKPELSETDVKAAFEFARTYLNVYIHERKYLQIGFEAGIKFTRAPQPETDRIKELEEELEHEVLHARKLYENYKELEANNRDDFATIVTQEGRIMELEAILEGFVSYVQDDITTDHEQQLFNRAKAALSASKEQQK